jgi:NAD(P)-dependent dehydrogenase (short-subunit alcohol dehydrogenase family)
MAVEIDLAGRSAIVTGAGSGIGREVATLLGRAGANVAAADDNEAAAKETAAIIEQAGGTAITVTVDVRDPQQARQGVAATVERFGGLDILVNNAAAWSVDLFKNLTYEQYQLDVGVTLIGTMVMTKAAYDHMREQNSGTVVNLISDAGRIGEPFLVSYSAAKGGVVGFTKAFAKEAGRYGIRCNAVSPGTTKTPGASPLITKWGGEETLVKAYPLGRLGEPIDQANAILFFCSDLSSWITGQILSVSGGYSMVD